jgi:putative tryptophan/tyrosine transport system permease protein
VELWIGAINLGFLYAFMAMGVFITFRIHDFPDITVDGSFVTGAAMTAVLVVAGVNPWVALALSFLAAGASGAVTALIHTRFQINSLLAGIMVMTGLYSINLHIMGRSNIPLLNEPGLMAYAKNINPGLPYEVWLCLIFGAIIAAFWLIISLFFRTDFGISMRATGNNPAMAAASGINVNGMKIFGVALANGLVGLSGSLVAQYQGFADIGMGIGSVVFGLAAVIIGETVLPLKSIWAKTLSVIIGSIIFRLMVALALYVGLNPIDLKLITAVFVLAILIAPKIIQKRRAQKGAIAAQASLLPFRKKFPVVLGLLTVAILCAMGGYIFFRATVLVDKPKLRIGIVQLTDHDVLNMTRDGFIRELSKLGYENGKNVTLFLENANGDMATVNSILDKFLHDRVDVVVPISTGCTQAAINKIKDKPVVFATVANPFLIGTGASDTDHLPNVTGVYGAVPMDKMIELTKAILPGKIKIGCIWDPSQVNAVFNVKQLQIQIAKHPEITFAGTTVTGSAEVQQAAQALVGQGIDAFVLVTDNIVFSALESVIKAADARGIPVILSDVERLGDGALAACGYDYAQSGMQAARLVDRILKGENPARIPFERYRKLTLGVNPDVAVKLGIILPQALLSKSIVVTSHAKKDARPKRLALFVFSDSNVLELSAKGIIDELKQSGVLQKHHMTVDVKNAQNDYSTAQAIVQDIVRLNYDYIITASSLALQVTANGNKKIPHVFGTVTDPYRMGIAKNAAEHIPNITGVATFQPVESTVSAMRAIFPKARRIGIVWNPSEANSEACTLKARAAARKYSFELVERTVTRTDEVKDAAMAVINSGVDLFLTSGDNTVILAQATVAQVMQEHKIPYFTNDPSDIERGAFFSIGADYYQVGVETAKMAARVINGEDPKNIPIREFVPEAIGVSVKLAARYGVTIPEDLLKKAIVVKR